MTGVPTPSSGETVRMAEVFVRRSRIEAPPRDVFAWHARPGALERLVPPWQKVEVIKQAGGIEDGGRVVLRVGPPPFGRWVAEHRDYVEGVRFCDVQVDGPFARWEHTHSFEPAAGGACMMEDRIEYELPLARLTRPFAPLVRRSLERTFRYRHAVVAGDAGMGGGAPASRKHVLVSGASGLIGSALVPALSTAGDRVTRLVRSGGTKEGSVAWDPAAGRLDAGELRGVNAAVHLAGETVAGRWTDAKRKRILESRTRGTRLLAETLAGLEPRPSVLVCASAIGYYGDRGDEELTEASAPGSGFLADVVGEWEEATRPAAEAGITVVNLRFGVVLSPSGGALGAMLTPFKLGVGGPFGSGDQWMSWIAIDDVVGAIQHALGAGSLSGPVNATAPQPGHEQGVLQDVGARSSPARRRARAGLRSAARCRRVLGRAARRSARVAGEADRGGVPLPLPCARAGAAPCSR